MWTPNPYYEKYLAHYGTKGMKWGIINEDEKDKMHRQMMTNTQKAQQAHRDAAAGRYASYKNANDAAVTAGRNLKSMAAGAKNRADMARQSAKASDRSRNEEMKYRNNQETPGYGRGLMPKGGMDESAAKQRDLNQRRQHLETKRDQMVEYLQKNQTGDDNEYYIKILNDAKTTSDIEKALLLIGNILNGNTGNKTGKFDYNYIR